MELSGKKASEDLLLKLSKKIKELDLKIRLDVLQVGSDPASSVYIKQKEKAALKSGLQFQKQELDRTSSFEDIFNKIQELNNDANCSAFILQLPLDTEKKLTPQEVNKVLATMDPEKDADGLHPMNQAALLSGESTSNRWTSPLPATALGIIRLLEHNQISLESKNACVLGRSKLVGMPTALLLNQKNATVTLCHSRTRDIKKHTLHAEIVIAAAGKMHMLGEEHFQDNHSIVIDVGIHRQENGKLSGDLNPLARKKLKAFSPVPRGVGPMTVAALIENTVQLELKKNNKDFFHYEH